ncbi:MAG: hypothetical protein ACYC27_09850 [Armatimonadota bacterium]
MSTRPGSYMNESEPPFSAETSVETALNSRCSSDHDGNPMNFHWGMYNSDEPVHPEYIHALERGLQVPRFTFHELHAELDERPIVLSMSNDVKGIDREWLHIESGMQHQAAHLVCAALGLGTCILNLGTDGKVLRDGRLGTARMSLEMMTPSYNGSMWSADAPNNWVTNPSLPEPKRDGPMPLLKAVEDASTSGKGRLTDQQDISQLLWAARGRTPHYYMSKPWGLTIPTWAGGQNIAALYFTDSNGTCKYVNWADDKPAHMLEKIGGCVFTDSQAQIIMGVNENTGRALWEVGYMLESLILQATALNIRYDANLLPAETRAIYESCGVKNARAMFTLYSE